MFTHARGPGEAAARALLWWDVVQLTFGMFLPFSSFVFVQHFELGGDKKTRGAALVY